MRLRFVLVLSSIGTVLGPNNIMGLERLPGRIDSWSFPVLFNHRSEVVIATITAVAPPPDGEVRLAISKTIWGSPRASMRIPIDYPEDLRVGEEYVVGYSIQPVLLHAVAKPEPELLDLLSAYAAMRSQIKPGEIPLDEDGTFMGRILSLLFHESPAGRLAEGFIIGGRLRRSPTDPMRDCCEIAVNLTSADWDAIERAVTDSSVSGMSRRGFLAQLGLSTYLRNGPSIVAQALIDEARALRRHEGTPDYIKRRSSLNRNLFEWSQYFEIPDRIRYYELLQQSGDPVLMQFGKNLPNMPWYKNEMKMRREARPDGGR